MRKNHPLPPKNERKSSGFSGSFELKEATECRVTFASQLEVISRGNFKRSDTPVVVVAQKPEPKQAGRALTSVSVNTHLPKKPSVATPRGVTPVVGEKPQSATAVPSLRPRTFSFSDTPASRFFSNIKKHDNRELAAQRFNSNK